MRGNDSRIDYEHPKTDPIATLFWIGMGSAWRMLPMQRREPNRINVAEGNGLLTGYLSAAQVPAGRSRSWTIHWPT